MSDIAIYTIGFSAQLLFSARLLIQWILSERARRSLSPSIFWFLSLAASIIFIVYGWLRQDFAIIVGQLISFQIYIWNLSLKGEFLRLRKPWRSLVKGLLIAFPFVLLGVGCLEKGSVILTDLFQNEENPLWLLLFGLAGQIIFTLRFVYQWWVSRRRKTSVLPSPFWIISLVGSAIIVAYGLYRRDPVLILGQSVGFVVYIRNLVLCVRERQKNVESSDTLVRYGE